MTALLSLFCPIFARGVLSRLSAASPAHRPLPVGRHRRYSGISRSVGEPAGPGPFVVWSTDATGALTENRLRQPQVGFGNPRLCYGLLISKDACDIAVDDLMRQRDQLVVQCGCSMVECNQAGWFSVTGGKHVPVPFLYDPYYLELLEPSERDVHQSGSQTPGCTPAGGTGQGRGTRSRTAPPSEHGGARGDGPPGGARTVQTSGSAHSKHDAAGARVRPAAAVPAVPAVANEDAEDVWYELLDRVRVDAEARHKAGQRLEVTAAAPHLLFSDLELV